MGAGEAPKSLLEAGNPWGRCQREGLRTLVPCRVVLDRAELAGWRPAAGLTPRSWVWGWMLVSKMPRDRTDGSSLFACYLDL